MSHFGRVGRFLIVALPLYAGCLLLWTPIAGNWGDGYRFFSRAVLGRFGEGVQVRFTLHENPTRYVDTQVVITSDRAPGVEAVADSGSLSGTYLPSALLVSLVAGTRMPARRRLVSLALGVALVHVAAVAVTALALLDQLADHPEFRPFAVPDTLRPALATVAAAVRGHFYPMLAVTCGIWAAVTFGSPPAARPTPARAAIHRAR